MREVGEVGAIQRSKCQKLTDFLPKLLPNVNAEDLLGFVSDSQIASWKAMKAQRWTWPANLWALSENQQSNKDELVTEQPTRVADLDAELQFHKFGFNKNSVLPIRCDASMA